ncbi:MAG: XRE family transcriptional regulator [Syntrophorhabdales bacterium]|jgi:transcriptional regulator with XRE-family HTH domain
MNEKIVAENIRRARLEQGLSIEQLARRAGFTKGYVSKIENSEKAPPLSTLTKLAIALKVDVGFLLAGNSERGENVALCIIRTDERQQSSSRGAASGYRFERLAFKKAGRNMEPLILTPSLQSEKVLSYDGEEFMYVLEGTVELVYDSKRYTFHEGDSGYFDASVPHSGRSVGDKEAKLLVVTYYYKRR